MFTRTLSHLILGALLLSSADAAAQSYTFDNTCAPVTRYETGREAPNVLIILDNSGSMSGTKWNTAVQVIKELADAVIRSGTCSLMTRSGCDDIRLGLGYFGHTAWTDVQPADRSNSNAIYTSLGNTSPNGSNTSMNLGTTQISSSTTLKDATRTSIGVFITDGEPNPSTATRGAKTNLCDAKLRATAPVTTYVVGFGSGANPHINSMLAAAGGTGVCKTSGGATINVCNLTDNGVTSLQNKQNANGFNFSGASCTGALQANNGQALKDGLLAIATNAACTFPLTIPAGYPAGEGADEDPFATKIVINHNIFGQNVEVQPYLALQPNLFYDYLVNARGVAPAAAAPMKDDGWVFADLTRKNVRFTGELCQEIAAGKLTVVDTQVACLCRFTGQSCDVPGQLGRCQEGAYACVAGRDVCQQLYPRMPEICNGVDDNCDGSTDNMDSAQADWNPATMPLADSERGLFCSFQNVCGCGENPADDLGMAPGPMDNAWAQYKATWSGNCRCGAGVDGEDPGVSFGAADDASASDDAAACSITTPARDATGALSLLLSFGFLAAFTGRRRSRRG
jgi:hypothetical protein